MTFVQQIIEIMTTQIDSLKFNLLRLLILTISIIFGIIVWNWGIRVMSVGFDRSGRIGGFYYWKTPYKGYNRFRSQKWNEEHTM